MKRSNNKLRLTLPWHAFIGRLVAEEHRVALVRTPRLAKLKARMEEVRSNKGSIEEYVYLGDSILSAAS